MEIGAMFRFRRTDFSEEEIRDMRCELVLTQRSGEKYGFGRGQAINMFHEVADHIEIPRQYALANLGDRISDIVDRTEWGTQVRFRFTAPLRPVQEPLVQDFLSKIGKHPHTFGGIFSAPCGTGKTIMTLKALSELGRASIVLVHTAFLMKQWRESILGGPNNPPFTDLLPSDVGRIQQEVCDWKGKKIVLAMVESLCARVYEPEMYRHFGVAALDEVHRHGAAEWGRAVGQFPARIRIGLSATPRRADGLWNVVKWHVGEVLTRGESNGLAAKVFIVPTGAGLYHSAYQTGGNRINLGKLVSKLCGIDPRNVVIVDNMVRAVQSGRRVLILSDRRQHLEDLEFQFNVEWSKRGLEKDKFSVARYVGGMTEKQMDAARKCNLLFGTYQYAKEGLDDPLLDTIFLATPKGDVEQAVGRILRPVDGKKEPYIIDFIDEKVGPCVDFAKGRRNQYRRLGFEVVEVQG